MKIKRIPWKLTQEKIKNKNNEKFRYKTESLIKNLHLRTIHEIVNMRDNSFIVLADNKKNMLTMRQINF